MRRTRTLLLVAAGLGLGAPLHAAPLAPTRPSDLVVLRSTFDRCTAPAGGIDGGRAFTDLQNADGRLTIPPGRVLVITRIDVSSVVLGPSQVGGYVQIVLTRQSATQGQQIAWVSGSFSSGEEFSHAFTFPNGIVLRPEQTLCGLAHDSFATEHALIGTAYGYLAKDH